MARHSSCRDASSKWFYMLHWPFLALGLCDAAWQRERGKESSLLHSMKAITRNSTSQWMFAVALAVAMIFWMRIAALLHALYPSVQEHH